MSVGRPAWVLELDEGQWRGVPPAGRLRLRVVGVARSGTPGFVVVAGWRQFADAKPRFCRVVVRAELVIRRDEPGPGRKSPR